MWLAGDGRIKGGVPWHSRKTTYSQKGYVQIEMYQIWRTWGLVKREGYSAIKYVWNSSGKHFKEAWPKCFKWVLTQSPKWSCVKNDEFGEPVSKKTTKQKWYLNLKHKVVFQ